MDGTLLDHYSYSYEAARPALQLLRQNRIPVILVSSKTRGELRSYQKELGLETMPYVVENGSAIYTPAGLFEFNPADRETDDEWCYILGTRYRIISDALREISESHGCPIRGFHNSSVDEIAERTALPRDKVEQAMDREFSVPVFFDEAVDGILKSAVGNYDLRLLYGGRFIHVLGPADKGIALKLLSGWFAQKWGVKDATAIAIGDSLNDFDMLRAADIAVLVQKPDGSYESRERIESVIFSPAPGPEGWNQSVLELINSGGSL